MAAQPNLTSRKRAKTLGAAYRRLADMNDTTVSESLLSDLGIRRGPRLDVEDLNPRNLNSETEPVFFQPLLNDALEQKVMEYQDVYELGLKLWEYQFWEPCTAPKFDDDGESHLPNVSCADRNSDSLTSLYCCASSGLKPADAPESKFLWPDWEDKWPCFRVRYSDLQNPHLSLSQRRNEWTTKLTYGAVDVPHTGCLVIDSTKHEENNILRSEILTLLFFIKLLPLKVPKNCSGRTLPGIGFSIGHDTARITQMWCDTKGRVTFRQSRVLKLDYPLLNRDAKDGTSFSFCGG
ncbi:hypothetical protein B0T24DRAFT_367491 [Lasiosphaeria ovina]|uniref:Uncharacterized protein n=1 Tax=Lasiosphaeria ovina TaxID=92902 RepID=A0AAE0N0W0_9PEZI|nr:hypothetical protein B0T24DRAFT_367491 [Lasiosphaeria ovina]